MVFKPGEKLVWSSASLAKPLRFSRARIIKFVVSEDSGPSCVDVVRAEEPKFSSALGERLSCLPNSRRSINTRHR